MSISRLPHWSRSAAPAVGNGHFSAVAFGLFGRIGLDLILVSLAPYDEADTRGGSVSERHRRAGFGFQLRRRLLAVVAKRTMIEFSCRTL
jgi:hypothetical protein